MELTNIEHIGIAVKNLEESIKFYENVFLCLLLLAARIRNPNFFASQVRTDTDLCYFLVRTFAYRFINVAQMYASGDRVSINRRNCCKNTTFGVSQCEIAAYIENR